MSNNSNDKLRRIFNVTGGICHLCGRRLGFDSYGQAGRSGAWEIEHGNPRSRGGVNDLRNLKPACVSCNRSKGDLTTSEYRRLVGASTGESGLEIFLKMLAVAALINLFGQNLSRLTKPSAANRRGNDMLLNRISRRF